MKRRLSAVLTALCCAAACMPVVSQTVSAAYGGEFPIISIAYDEKGAAASYLLYDRINIYEITAEEMALYLTEDSAQPQVGDVVSVAAELGRLPDDAPGYFEYSEDSTISVVGTIEEYYPLKRDFVLLREYMDSGTFLMQDTETGDKYVFRQQDYYDYIPVYNMDGAEVGDMVSFFIEVTEYDSGTYERPYLPCTLTKGGGTIPELPEAVIHDSYSTVSAVVVAPDLVSVGGGEYGFGPPMMFEYGVTDEMPACGDVLMIDASSFTLIYPGQINIPQNGQIVNLGSAADVYGTKTYTVLEKTQYESVYSDIVTYQLQLQDADGNMDYYSTTVEKMRYRLYHSAVAKTAQVGDTISFMLDEEGDPVVPLEDETMGTLYTVTYTDDSSVWYVDNDMTMSKADFTNYLAEGSPLPQYGDVIEVEGEHWVQTTYPTCFYGMEGNVIRNHGSSAKFFGTVGVTLTEKTAVTETQYDFVFTDAAGQEYTYHRDTEYIPVNTEITGLTVGDEVVFSLDKDGNLAVPIEVIPIGDANLDSTLDIMDVIMLNKYLLGAQELPDYDSEATYRSRHPADFNRDGTADAADCLNIMRKIVGLI